MLCPGVHSRSSSFCSSFSETGGSPQRFCQPMERHRSTGIKESRYIHADERGKDAERQRKPASRERPPLPGRNCFPRWGRGGWREGAGGRSTWQEEMITMTRNIMMMIMSTIKNSESPLGEPEHACRRDCTAGGSGRGEGEERRRQRLRRQHPQMNNNNAQRKLRFSLKIQPSA